MTLAKDIPVDQIASCCHFTVELTVQINTSDAITPKNAISSIPMTISQSNPYVFNNCSEKYKLTFINTQTEDTKPRNHALQTKGCRLLRNVIVKL